MLWSLGQGVINLWLLLIIWLMMLWSHVGVRGSPCPDVMGFYLNLSSGNLTNISFHMCGSWYVPILLFRKRSFTLINITSLMVLAMLLSSLPTVLKLSRDNLWPVMLWWSWMGDGAFMRRWMFLILIIWCKALISLKIRTNFVSVVRLSPVYNMASSGLWKMLTFIILNRQNGVWENVLLYNIDTYYLLYNFWQMLCLRCQGRYNLPGRCYACFDDWQML